MEKKKRSGRSVGLVLVVLLFLGAAAQAELITIAIEATVDYVNDEDNYLEDKVNVGDIITGYYTYESTTPDSNPTDNNRGRYEHSQSPCGIFLTVGGIDFQTDLSDVDLLIGIYDNYNYSDTYTVTSYNNISSCGINPDIIGLGFRDDSKTALQNDSLPTSSPVLEQWNSFNSIMIDALRKYQIEATVTSAVLIPEPTTIMLLLLGSLFLRRKS